MKHPYFILILLLEQRNGNTASKKKMESAMKTWVKEKES